MRGRRRKRRKSEEEEKEEGEVRRDRGTGRQRDSRNTCTQLTGMWKQRQEVIMIILIIKTCRWRWNRWLSG